MSFIPRLVSLIQDEGYDLISCNRLTRELTKQMPAANKLANQGFALFVRTLYGLDVHDVSTGMFAMKRDVAHSVGFETNYSLPCEIIVRTNMAGFRHKEIDIPYRIRLGEVTLHRWRSGKAYLRCIFNYRFKLGIDPKNL